ncbi:MAG: hypothetical protein WBD72_03660 [Candidatus Acidiferrum sp.]
MKKTLSFLASLSLIALPGLAQQPVASRQEVQQQPQNAGMPDRTFVLEDATPIKLVLGETISSADATVGQLVSFEVVEDILVDGVVVIPNGGTAWATVTAAQTKRRMGRGGKLDLNIDKVRLADGSKTLLSAVKNAKGGGHTGAMTGAIVATSLILWPAAPFFLFIHGKDITIPKGTALTAFVQGDDVLDRSRFVKSSQPVTPMLPASPSTVAQVPPQQAAAHQEPVMQIQSTDQEPSLGEIARENRAKKAQQQQQQTPPQNQPQN